MATKIAGVAGAALTAASDCRGDELAAAGRVVAGGAAVDGMDFSQADKGRGGGGMATDTIGRGG